MQNISHSTEAKKIAKILSDGRLTDEDLDTLALMLVMWIREPRIMDRVELFFDRFQHHRNSIEFGEAPVLTRADLLAMMEA